MCRAKHFLEQMEAGNIRLVARNTVAEGASSERCTFDQILLTETKFRYWLVAIIVMAYSYSPPHILLVLYFSHLIMTHARPSTSTRTFDSSNPAFVSKSLRYPSLGKYWNACTLTGKSSPPFAILSAPATREK